MKNGLELPRVGQPVPLSAPVLSLTWGSLGVATKQSKVRVRANQREPTSAQGMLVGHRLPAAWMAGRMLNVFHRWHDASSLHEHRELRLLLLSPARRFQLAYWCSSA